jgi:hypothetical protein
VIRFILHQFDTLSVVTDTVYPATAALRAQRGRRCQRPTKYVWSPTSQTTKTLITPRQKTDGTQPPETMMKPHQDVPKPGKTIKRIVVNEDDSDSPTRHLQRHGP